jgi:hypothetical protein
MRSAPHRQGASQRVPPCRHALRITAQSQVTSGRAAPAPARNFSSLSLNPPRTHHPAGRAAASPPPRFRSTPPPHAPPPPPTPKDAPHPAARCRRVPVAEAPSHTAPPANRPPPAAMLRGEALRKAVEVIGHLWLAPRESDLLDRASGTHRGESGCAGSRCRLRGRRFKWNLFDVRPLFHLSRRPSRRRRAPIGFACAKSVGQRIGNRKQCRPLNEKSFALQSAACPASID